MGNVFFTRDGSTVGDSIENRLLQKVGGADTIRKAYQHNADGSVTMLHTRGPGSQPEVITTPVKKTELLCPWSLDYNAVKFVASFQADYVTTIYGDTPTYDMSRGPKTRRFGLERIGSEYAVKIAESKYSALDTNGGKKVRGPHYWYSGDDVVTWTRHVAMQASGSTEYHAFGTIQYGVEKEIIAVPRTAPGTSNFELFAACLVKDGGGTTYVRAALARRDGFGGIQVRDYSDETTYTAIGYSPVSVSGHTITKIYPYMLAWSADGQKLITTFDSPSPNAGSKVAQALVYTVPIPGGGGSPTVAIHSFAAPMVTASSTSVPTDTNPTNAGATPVETAGITGTSTVSLTTTPPGTTTTYAVPSNGYSSIKNYSRKIFTTNTVVSATAAAVTHVGFSPEGGVCGAVTTHDTTVVTETVAQDTIDYASDIFSAIQDVPYTQYDGGYTLDYVVRYAGVRTTLNIGRTASGTHITTLLSQGVHVFESGVLTANITRNSSVTNTNYTQVDTNAQVVKTKAAHNASFVEASNSNTSVTVTDVSVSATNVIAQPKCALTEFFDGVVLLASQASYAQGSAGTVTTTVQSIVPAASPVTTVVTTPAGSPPSAVEATYELRRNGALLSSKTSSRSLGSYVPLAADWCAKHKSLLMVTDYAAGTFGGFLYKDGWFTLIKNPSEPTPEYSIGWTLNIGHF